MRRAAGAGPSFLRRVRIATMALGIVGALFVTVYDGLASGGALIAGLGLSLLNLLLLEFLFSRLLRPHPLWGMRIALALGLKLPLLIGGPIVGLWVLKLAPGWFLAGYSLVLLVVVLKVIGARLTDARRRGPSLGIAGFLGGLALLVGLGFYAFGAIAAAEEPPRDQHQGAAGHGAARETGEGPHPAEGGHEEEDHPPEFPNLVTILGVAFPDRPWTRFLHAWETPLFSLPVILLLGLLSYGAMRRPTLIPGKLQNAVETLVEGVANFLGGILGPEGRRYVPFLGTLFFYIWVSNLQGLIPFFKSPTSVYNTTLALAIIVFVYLQYSGVRRLGAKNYLLHLMGSPQGAIGWGMVPLMFPLHLIGELAKPVSLSLRLFGNVMGEDVLLAVFAGLGIGLLAFMNLPIGIPLHLPFIFLAILTSTIQALVFTTLSTIYFSQVLPHGDHGDHGDQGEHGDRGGHGDGRDHGDDVASTAAATVTAVSA